jgi:hypothetical protein
MLSDGRKLANILGFPEEASVESVRLFLLGFIVRGALEKAAKMPLEKFFSKKGLFSQKLAEVAEEIVREGVAKFSPPTLDWLNPELTRQAIEFARKELIFLTPFL